MGRQYCRIDNIMPDQLQEQVDELKNQFIQKLQKNQETRQIFIREKRKQNQYGQILTIREFVKQMDFKGQHEPRNYNELKEEIKLWPKVGMQLNSKGSLPSEVGFVRKLDFNHVYEGIEKDIDQLISEGYLIEFKGVSNLSEKVKTDLTQSSKNKKEIKGSLLMAINESEVNNQVQNKYPLQSLQKLSQLWEKQHDEKEFNWQEIIENKGLLDEDESNHYLFRKDQSNAQLKVQEEQKKERKRQKKLKNEHLFYILQ